MDRECPVAAIRTQIRVHHRIECTRRTADVRHCIATRKDSDQADDHETDVSFPFHGTLLCNDVDEQTAIEYCHYSPTKDDNGVHSPTTYKI